MNRLRRPARVVEGLGGRDRRCGVVGEQRGDLERDPAVDPVGALVDGQEEVGRSSQVLDGQLEEKLLAGESRPAFAPMASS